MLVYGVYEFVQPSQPPAANVFWAWILGIVLVSAVIATAIVYLRPPRCSGDGEQVHRGGHQMTGSAG